MNRNLLLMLLASSMIGGCGGGPRLTGGPEVAVVAGDALPPPEAMDGLASQRDYRIGPFDRLEIDVFGVEELRREVQADASGRVSFPLAGSIEAGGMTPGQLAEEISTRLRGNYVRDPQVTVNLRETASSLVTVEGAVREPGTYPVLGRMTLVRAIAAAKGVSETADLQHAVIFRTVNGERMAALYSVRAIREGRYADPEVYPNDVVLVGESNARRFFRDLIQTAPLLTAPLIAVLNNNP